MKTDGTLKHIKSCKVLKDLVKWYHSEWCRLNFISDTISCLECIIGFLLSHVIAMQVAYIFVFALKIRTQQKEYPIDCKELGRIQETGQGKA